MKTLYLRIWLTVVAALALFALASGWLLQRHLAQERAQADAALAERMASWAVMIQNSLPEAGAPVEDQVQGLREWSARLHVPMALDDAKGQRLGASASFERSLGDGKGPARPMAIRLDDGRTLWVIRPWLRRVPGAKGEPGLLDTDPGGPRREPGAGGPGGPAGPGGPGEVGGPRDLGEPGFGMPPDWERPGSGSVRARVPPGPGGADPRAPDGPDVRDLGPRHQGWLPPFADDWPAQVGMLALLALLFVAVAAGAYPVVRHLTRRLEALKHGVETFGAGALHHRVQVDGRDEVATLATSFNLAAERIEALVRSNQRLLANASHELRSPLARLKMAAAMLSDAPPAQLAKLQKEVDTNIRELDALVDEVLLSSRLEAGVQMAADDPVDLLGLAAEEAARVNATAEGPPLEVRGSERLLRRAVRNLLENARRYGGDEVSAVLSLAPTGEVRVQVCDRGPGVPATERERIFEPFYRLAGHAERDGGVGLGLALVRQIARLHGGEVRCLPRQGGGSCFEITLPAQRVLPQRA